jgi:hypothetical protein
MAEQHRNGDIDLVTAEYRRAKAREDALTKQAEELAERFRRLAQALSLPRRRLFAGLPDELAEGAEGSSHSVPSREYLITLLDDIRTAATKVEELRERLILMGHADLVEEPDEFFR